MSDDFLIKKHILHNITLTTAGTWYKVRTLLGSAHVGRRNYIECFIYDNANVEIYWNMTGTIPTTEKGDTLHFEDNVKHSFDSETYVYLKSDTNATDINFKEGIEDG